MAITFADGGVYRVTALGNFDAAVEVRNVFQLRLLSGGPLDQADGLADLDDWVQGVLGVVRLVQSNLLTWRGFSVEELDGDLNTGEIGFNGGSFVGLLTSDPLPPGVAMLQYMPTGVVRRQLRKYWASFVETQLDTDGNFLAATATAVAGNVSYFLDDYAGVNGTWAFGHAHPGDGSSFVRPVAVNTSINPAYQRRRRRGRGI